MGYLKQTTKAIRRTRDVQVGEVVLVEMPNQKRLNWPLGKIVENFPGKDGFVRLVKVKTKNGEFLRPVQRLYFLEVQSATEDIQREISSKGKNLRTRKPRSAEYAEEVSKCDQEHQAEPEEATVRKPEKTTRLGRRIQAPRRLDL